MKRDIFRELMEGVDALAAQRQRDIAQLAYQRTQSDRTPGARSIGAMKGELVLPHDLDSPLPDDMLNAFEGIQHEDSA